MVWRHTGARRAGRSGVAPAGSALLGLVRGSGVVAVTGDRDAARRLTRTPLGLVDGVRGHRVLVAGGMLPRTPGFALADLLDAIPEHAPAARTFLFCEAPTPAEADRLRLLAVRDARLTVIVLGALPGAGLTMRVSDDGRLAIDGLAVPHAPEPRPAPGAQPPLPHRVPAGIA